MIVNSAISRKHTISSSPPTLYFPAIYSDVAYIQSEELVIFNEEQNFDCICLFLTNVDGPCMCVFRILCDHKNEFKAESAICQNELRY